jgi:hypothetical protein
MSRRRHSGPGLVVREEERMFVKKSGWRAWVLVSTLALAGAMPAAAQTREPGRSMGTTGWLAGLWEMVSPWAAVSPAGNAVANLVGIWANEGAGFDPNGGVPTVATPPRTTSTKDEGAGFDPNGDR